MSKKKRGPVLFCPPLRPPHSPVPEHQPGHPPSSYLARTYLTHPPAPWHNARADCAPHFGSGRSGVAKKHVFQEFVRRRLKFFFCTMLRVRWNHNTHIYVFPQVPILGPKNFFLRNVVKQDSFKEFYSENFHFGTS